MENIRERLIHIHQCRMVNWKTLYHFLKQDSSLHSVYQMSKQELTPFFQGDRNKVNVFYHDLHFQTASDLILKYRNQQIFPITIIDPEYPPLLKHIYDPPWVLYAKGHIHLLQTKKCISVVGTRTPSENGTKSMEKVIPPLVHTGWVIVSGLANGIDTGAHMITIREKGTTISVLGSGFSHIYPSKNISLAHKIAMDHLLLSEYPPYQRPQKWHFPRRNRIISGLSLGTIVVEAMKRSGSLITAYQALESGREVFAIPGSILESRSVGTNLLIKDGANSILTAEDVMETLNPML